MTGSLPLFVEQNDVEATKAAPVMNSAKADPTAASVPVNVPLNDAEMKKVQEECKRMQAEMSKLVEENRHLKVRYVKVTQLVYLYTIIVQIKLVMLNC